MEKGAGRSEGLERGLVSDWSRWKEMAANKKKDRWNQGLTMIELIVVIVILGIMSAIALPRFLDLQGQAQRSARDGLTSTLRSAASLAYAQAAINNSIGALNANAVYQALQVTGGITLTGNNFTAIINGTTYTWAYTFPASIGDPSP